MIHRSLCCVSIDGVRGPVCEAFFGVSTSSPILGLDRPVGDDDLGVQCSGCSAGNHFFTCVGMQATMTMLKMGWDRLFIGFGGAIVALIVRIERVLGLFGPVSFPVLFGRSSQAA